MSIERNVPGSDISNALLVTGAALVEQRMRAMPAIFPMFTEVINIDFETGAPLSDGIFGHRETGLVGGTAAFGKFGIETDASSMGNDWTRLLAVRPVGAAHGFSRETVNQALRTGNFSTFERFMRGAIDDCIRVCDQRVADLLQKGTLSAGNAVFDQSFEENVYADPYPLKIYNNCPFFGTQALKLSSATPSNITASLALSATNLGTVRQTMSGTNNVNERGQKMVVTPNMLVVPPGLEGTAKVIVSSEQVPGSSNNDRNWLQGQFGVVVNSYLSDDTDAWWTLDTNLGPIRVADSGAPRIIIRDDGGPVVRVEVKKYFGAAPWLWQGAYAANKATS